MPRPTTDDNSARIIAQALLPGLEIALQDLQGRIQQCRHILGLVAATNEVVIHHAPEPKPAPPEPVDPSLRLSQRLIAHASQHGGMIIMRQFGIDNPTVKPGSAYSALNAMIRDSLVRKLHAGEYQLIRGPKPNGKAPEKAPDGRPINWREQLSKQRKRAWAKMSPAERKKRQAALQAGKAKAQAARQQTQQTGA